MSNRYFLCKGFILHLLIICVLTSCANTQDFSNTESIYVNFENYSGQFNENNEYSSKSLDKIFSSLTPRYQAEILNSRAKTPELLKQLTNDYLAFPLLLKENIKHFEKITNDTACLVINGKTIENEKIAFYLTYKKIDNWLIDYIKIEHMANYNQYLTEAVCDRKFLDELRFREMMAQ